MPEVHLFQMRNQHFALNPESLSVFALTPKAFELAKRRLSGDGVSWSWSPDDWLTEYQVQKMLVDAKPLGPRRIEDQKVRLREDQPELNCLWLGLAHTCNLGCRYCFANEPNYLQRDPNSLLMSKQTARHSVDYLVNASPDQKEYTLIFFGGEPLLNFEVMQSTIEYCSQIKEKRFLFSVTTNGTLLTPEINEYLYQNRVSVMISLDGTKQGHDRNRPFRDGTGSWDVIVHNLARLSEDARANLAVRATISDTSVHLFDIYKELRSYGFRSVTISEVCPNSGSMPIFPAEQVAQWKEQYLELAEAILEDANSLEGIEFRNIKRIVEVLFYGHRSYYCCSTGLNAFYVAPDGALFPCMRLITENSENQLGTLEAGVEQDQLMRFKANNIFERDCKDCWARYLCGGLCYGDAYSVHKDIRKTVEGYCEMARHKFEVAAYLLLQMQNQGLISRQDGSLQIKR